MTKTAIRFDSRFNCFVAGRRRMTGAHAILRKWYNADYASLGFLRAPAMEYDEPADGAENAEKADPAAAAAAGPVVSTELKAKTDVPVDGLSAVERGRRVDEDIRAWASTGSMPADAHAYARRFARACNKWKLEPVGSQGICGIPKARVATQYDVLLKTPRGKLVLVEVKTGSSADAFRAAPTAVAIPAERRWCGEAASLPQNQLTYACLQLLLTGLLFYRTHNRKIAHMFVIHLHPLGVSAYCVDNQPWAKRVLSDMKFRIGQRMD